MSINSLYKFRSTLVPALVLGLTIGLVGCGSGKSGDGLLGPAPPVGTASSSSSSSSSSGVALPTTGSFIDPISNQAVVASMKADAGVVKYGVSRDVVITFTTAAGAPVVPASVFTAKSRCIPARADISEPVISANTVKFSYTPKNCVGEDTLTFYATGASKTVEVGNYLLKTEGNTVAGIQFVSAVPGTIAIAGAGHNEESKVTFLVKGQGGDPIVNEPIEFSIQGSAGGVNVVNSTARSDASGLAVAQVRSGTTPNTVTIIATHKASGLSAKSDGLVVASGLSKEGWFTIGLDVFNPRALRLLNKGTTNVTAAITDPSGNPVADGTVVNFVSTEGGSVTPSCRTVNNTCTVAWKSDGRDPVDGRAQILATTKGTEHFNDMNGNLIFDDGDVFDAETQDIGEPFSDNNDNGIYEAGEHFVDTNANGTRDAGDGKWNGLGCKHSTLCSATTTIIDLGFEATVFMASAGVKICAYGDFAGAINVKPESVIALGNMYLSDGNEFASNPGYICPTGNPPAAGTKITFSVSAGTLVGDATFAVPSDATVPTGGYGVTYKAGEKESSEILTMKVEVPGSLAQSMSWPINVRKEIPTSSSSSSSSSGSMAGVFIDPISGKPTTVVVAADAGPVAYDQTRDVSLTFTDSTGAPLIPASTIKATSPCAVATPVKSLISAGVATNNVIKFVYTAKGCEGDDGLVFTAVNGATSVPVATYTLVTKGESVGSISYVSTTPSQISIAGNGGVEEAEIKFKVTGQGGTAVVNEQVDFTLVGAAGGVTLQSLSARTDGFGVVTARVRSGSIPVVVTVIATSASTGLKAPSSGLVVASGLSAEGFFNMGLSVFNPNAYNYIGAGLTDITVAVTDLSGNPVLDGTSVNFVSKEGGVVTPSCKTVGGFCTVEWKSDGRKPADGRAQVFATVRGTEHYADLNGNLLFDDGDLFDLAKDDLGEPYADLNSNNQYDVGEHFVDSNSNGVRDVGDGKWNGLNCKHSTLCAAVNSIIDIGQTATITMSRDDSPTICATGTYVSPIAVAIGASTSLNGLYLSDGNTAATNAIGGCPTGNSLPVGTTVTFTVSAGVLQGTSSWTIGKTDRLPNGPYDLNYVAGATAGTAILTMTIVIPSTVEGAVGKTTTRTWIINVN